MKPNSAIILLATLLLCLDNAFCDPLPGHWEIKLTGTRTTRYVSGSIYVGSPDKVARLPYGKLPLQVYPNGYVEQIGYETFTYGYWRRNGSRFVMTFDPNGPPAIVNGPNNSVVVFKYSLTGRLTNSKKRFRGKYSLWYHIYVWDYFSGIFVQNSIYDQATATGRLIR